jgi:sugar transferase (PEP-CTERM/EpsH1 system associated)
MADLTGHHVGLQRVRRVYKKFVNHYTALSPDLADYLVDKIHVSPASITQTCNGVDTTSFYPSTEGVQAIKACPFDPAQHWLVGTVGRMQAVKDQVMLAHAFVLALTLDPSLQLRMRLVMVGDGPLRLKAQSVLDAAGLSHLAWLTGERDDVADIMRGLHVFALPSLAEGICNTLLEAMASGLPVIATAVGGNGHLVVPDVTGYLVEPGNPLPMASQLANLFKQPQRAKRMGLAGRQRVLEKFSLHSMVCAYESVYDQSLLRVSASRLTH